ncbi:hypothetical protein Tco_1001284 [Tanacetum coccineum]
MTRKLDDIIELPKSQPKRTYKEDLECEMVKVKIPKYMSWLDAYDEPIGDLDMMEDKVDNPSPQSLLGRSGSLGVNFSKLEIRQDDWELESKEVSFLGERLNLPIMPKEFEKVIFDEEKPESS